MKSLQKNRLLLTTALFTYGASAWANLTIDNFQDSTDYTITESGYTSSVNDNNYRSSLNTSNTIGGNRRISVVISSPTNYFEPLTLHVGQTGASTGIYRFIQDAGYKVFPQISLVYGQTSTGPSYLNQDFTSYSKCRVNFDGADGTINVNVIMYSNSGIYNRSLGFNVGPSNTSFSQDFLLSSFTGSASFTFSDVDVIDVQVQSASTIGGNDYAISSIEMVP